MYNPRMRVAGRCAAADRSKKSMPHLRILCKCTAIGRVRWSGAQFPPPRLALNRRQFSAMSDAVHR